MTAHEIKAYVASYLRYKRQCVLVAFERGLFYNDFPDVLAVTDDMRLLEVEVKLTLADFRADAKKDKWHPRWKKYLGERTFYYAVPTELADMVEPELRPGAGLMVVGPSVGLRFAAPVVVKRQAARAKERIDMRTFYKMVRAQTGTMISMALLVNDLRGSLAETLEKRALEFSESWKHMKGGD